MATVTFHTSMPTGLRLQALFSPIVSGSLNYGTEAGLETASFQITIYEYSAEAFYAGPSISAQAGDVSSLRFGGASTPWLTLGTMPGPVQFSYTDLTDFHAQGAVAAAAALAGDDQFVGSPNGDYMDGYAGNDHLDGRGGNDTLEGGPGDDTYMVDHKDDRVVERSGEGHDIVHASTSFAMAADAEIEELRATPESDSLSLSGNDFNNFIVGTSGSDELDGKGGIDTLTGGAGSDLYIVDHASDRIVEDGGNGHDTVVASTSYRLGENLEILKAAAGTSSIDLTGNLQSNEVIGNLGANVIDGLDGNDSLYGDGGNDRIHGGDGEDVLYGGIGSDTLDAGTSIDWLYGDVGNDVLKGAAGDDRLYGGAGSDSLDGGEGKDQLYGDVGKDTLDGGAGNDRLFGGTGDNRLFGQIGHDTLYGGMNIDKLYGGSGNDKLYGDAGNDHLEGGRGKDTLSGGWGQDRFIFRDTPNTKTNVDTITDFDGRNDAIHLENAIFGKLGRTGRIDPDIFAHGSRAKDADDRLIYQESKGYLFYDPDGSGSRPAVLIAKLSGHPGVTAGDFHVI